MGVRWRFVVVGIVALACWGCLALVACSSDETIPAPADPADARREASVEGGPARGGRFDLRLGATSVTMARGSSAKIDVDLVSIDGFTAAVLLGANEHRRRRHDERHGADHRSGEHARGAHDHGGREHATWNVACDRPGQGRRPRGDGRSHVVVRGASGSLDTTFGDGGVVTAPLPGRNGDANLNDMLLTSDDRIVVAGGIYDIDTNKNHMVVARLTSDGALDNTFATGGVFETSPGTGLQARAVARFPVAMTIHEPTHLHTSAASRAAVATRIRLAARFAARRAAAQPFLLARCRGSVAASEPARVDAGGSMLL